MSIDTEKINKRMETLAKNLPFSLLNEEQLKKLAVSLKEDIFLPGAFLPVFRL